MSTSGHPQHIHGAYYAAPQVGGHAGGHGNTNTIINGGEETFKVQIATIKAKLAANISDDADDWVSLAQLVKMKKELNSLLSKVGDLEGRILERLPPQDSF
ncbi:hypothetical protein EYR40_004847 [Pleurotus pulmonarius]|nr:hypothetical protein EYR36_006772 [Pleurotus pulmonarius]KAF4601467.1 hypothetical protein EYR38_006120 [Pleurotus pulmonarius]KAF4601648.1 hypothetical protein EYR40_004847 [Pleurotus pulmonarius]